MRAFQVTEYGKSPQISEVEVPQPGPGELRLKVAACGLNFADLLMVTGEYQERPPLPFALGMEMSGTVEALGEGVSGPAVGTRVGAFGGRGGLADYAVVPADRCVPLADTMSFDEAAAFPVAYGTSHVALSHRARLAKGETLLVLGAAGGVGLTAVEIGKLMGARVIACARGAAKLEVAKAAGADHLIDSETDDIRQAVKDLGGCDVVYDPVGGPHFMAALRATRPEGRLITIGFASGEVPQIPSNLLLVKNLTAIGFYWGGYMGFRPKVVTDSLAQLYRWHEEGRLHPHISHRLALEQAAEGLDLLRSRRSTGKVVITI